MDDDQEQPPEVVVFAGSVTLPPRRLTATSEPEGPEGAGDDG